MPRGPSPSFLITWTPSHASSGAPGSSLNAKAPLWGSWRARTFDLTWGADYHVARVTASDDAWAAFRQAALAQGTPVSRYLGRLVEAELERRQTRPVRRVSGKAGAIEDGLAALREVRLAIDELDAIAGRPRLANRGGSWNGIGAALKLRPDAARNAYRGPA